MRRPINPGVGGGVEEHQQFRQDRSDYAELNWYRFTTYFMGVILIIALGSFATGFSELDLENNRIQFHPERFR